MDIHNNVFAMTESTNFNTKIHISLLSDCPVQFETCVNQFMSPSQWPHLSHLLYNMETISISLITRFSTIVYSTVQSRREEYMHAWYNTKSSDGNYFFGVISIDTQWDVSPYT